jgi:hypothetical protein
MVGVQDRHQLQLMGLQPGLNGFRHRGINDNSLTTGVKDKNIIIVQNR